MQNRLLILLLTTCLSITAPAALPPTATGTNTLAPMLERVMPAVVNIVIEGDALSAQEENGDASNPPSENGDEEDMPPEGRAPSNPSQQNRPGSAPRHFMAVASGVIYDPQHGYIITNNHVVVHAKKILVNLSDGRRYRARLIGRDELSEVAVIQIRAENMQGIPFADSNNVRVGDVVAAVGNPFGFEQTVTSGIVSALQRSDLHLAGPYDYESFIQTDAPINPGNSGGALVNMKGEIIGINTANFSPQRIGSSIGIGFAIPSNMVRSVADQLIKFGGMRRGVIGIEVQNLTVDLARAFHLSSHQGAVISQVIPGSPAETAGLKAGDILLQVNHSHISNANQARNAIGLLPMGSTIQLDILRAAKPKSLSVTSANPQHVQVKSERSNRYLYGLTLQNFDAQIPRLGHIQGVMILGVDENSPAWHTRPMLMPGDIIISASEHSVRNLADLTAIAEKAKEPILLNVIKAGGTALFVVLRATADQAENSDG